MGLLDSIFKVATGPIGGAIVGGLFGREESREAGAVAGQQVEASERNVERQIAFAREQQAQNEALQREFAQMGVRWRVEDAKAAGLHPLYALSSGGAAFAPNPIVMPAYNPPSAVNRKGYMSEMGQDLSRAIAAQETEEQRTLRAAQLKVLEAQAAKDFALAAEAGSRAAVTSQGAGVGFPPTGTVHELDVPPYPAGGFQMKAPEVIQSRPGQMGVAAGPAGPGLQEYRFPDGFKIMLPPGGNLSEALESLSESTLMTAFFLEMNSEIYGPGWYRELGKRMPGLRQLIETGEQLGEALPGIKRAWDSQFHKSVMPAAVPEFSETRRPAWYRRESYKGGTYRYR